MHSKSITEVSNLQNRLLESILVMQNDFIQRGIYYGWCESTLENLLFLSESEFGFICELLKKDDGTPYIKSHGITNIAWNEQTRNFYEENKEKGLEFFNFESLWGEAIIAGEPVIANDPDKDARRGGYPKDNGHPMLKSFLGLPVKGSDGKVVGVVGVANRPNGYNQEIVEFLTPFLNSYGLLIEKYRSDQQRKMLEVEREKLIADLKYSQDALKKNKELLDAAGRIAKVGGWELDAKTLEVIWTNETYSIHEVPFDYKPSLEKAIDFFHAEDRNLLERSIERSLEHAEPYDIEVRFITAKGNHLLTRSSCQPEIVDGKVVRLVGIFQDITARKLAENELQESKTFLDNILNNIGDPVFVKDDQHRLTIVNDAFCSIFGRAREEIIGKTLVEDVPPNEQDHFLEIDRQVLANGTEKSCEETLTVKGSEKLIILTKKTRHIAENGDKYLVGVIRDITERKAYETALRHSEERYKELFENAPFPYQSLDKNGCLLEANRRWLDHLGYLRDEVVGKSFADFLHPDWQGHFSENFSKFRSVGEVLGVEFQLKKKDGTYFWVKFDGKIKRDHTGDFSQTHCIFTDISEQKRLQDKVDMQNEALNQSQKLQSVGRLAGGIAHDFNNMLSIILGYTELALEKLETSDPLYGDMEEIYQAGKRSADMTRQLLAFARQQTVAPKVLNLNDNIGNMISMLRHLIGEDIDFSWTPGTELWSVKIDPSQIDQILANLCVNARDAITDVGKITIETKNIAFDQDYCANHAEFLPGEYVMLAVSDDGCGIAPDAMNQIFEPFFTTKKIGQGTGLGLATVYGIVKQNNGFINVYSELEKGTTIRVYFSRYVAQAVEVRNETAQEIPLSQGETILWVEDDASILKLGIRILENLGYKVLSTTRSKDAKKMAEEYDGQINLLITDVVMPEMNGRELSEQLQHFYPDLKILFMSGYTANVIAHRGVLDEGIYFISKPFSPKEIALKIREVLG